ncbi:MAG: NAD(P)-dependent glycerol-3-phosphate dehydrogenase [Bacilli bacterium]|jgi:glycerol-3-phosphate dehydrogenase (NAD(P)+)|nr:NAD(P)-dependent glycerol-3-phosphate dehydrogenase [Bacilli bacterium]
MKIAIIGSGSWATALAHVFAKSEHECVLIGRDLTSFDNQRHINVRYFPDIVLNERISFTTDMKSGLKDSDMILFCIPSSVMRSKAKEVASLLDHKVMILSATKGLDCDTFEPLSNVLKEELPKQYVEGVVSIIGPSFAEEVIQDKVTAIVAVSSNEEAAIKVQKAFSCETFRIYTNDDEIGCQIGAALKNVIAIAGGAIYGLGEGENAKAALVTRGLHEIIRLGVALGGKVETFYGLTGIGDLLLTCSSPKSRNFYLGLQIGQKDDSNDVLKANKKTVEGVVTCKYAKALADKLGISMPILNGVYSVLFEGQKPSQMVHETMVRKLKSEH